MPDASSTAVRYVEGGDNRLLKLALLEAWVHVCYWRPAPLSFDQAQIDHIVPRSAARDPAVLAALKLAAIDVDDPANLAPICGACNNEKSDVDYTDYPAIHRRVQKAQQLRDQVVRRVLASLHERAVVKHAVALSTMPFTTALDRGAFLEHGPAVVQRLADLDPAAADYRTALVVIEPPDDWHDAGTERRTITASLNTAGRQSELIAEHVCGIALPTLLEAAADTIGRAMRAEHQQWGDGQAVGDNPEQLSCGDAVSLTEDMVFDVITFVRDGDTYEFTLSADVDVSLDASAIRSDERGDGLEDVQVEGRVSGRVSVTAWWTVGDSPGAVGFGDTDTSAALAERWFG